MLQMISKLPPLLLNMVKHRCYPRLLWGHAEMRADRELLQRGAVGERDLTVFRHVLKKCHHIAMDTFAASFWEVKQAAEVLDPRVHVTVAQRDPGHGRSFVDMKLLVAAGLQPLAAKNLISWRVLEHLGKLPLVHQAAVFRSTDVFVGAVGAALAWLVVMQPGSQVLEWLPEGVPFPLYQCSEAWNVDTLGMFGGLGRLSGVGHVCLRAEAKPRTVADNRRWSGAKLTGKQAWWRKRDIAVDPDKFARWVSEGVRRVIQLRQKGAKFRLQATGIM